MKYPSVARSNDVTYIYRAVFYFTAQMSFRVHAPWVCLLRFWLCTVFDFLLPFEQNGLNQGAGPPAYSSRLTCRWATFTSRNWGEMEILWRGKCYASGGTLWGTELGDIFCILQGLAAHVVTVCSCS